MAKDKDATQPPTAEAPAEMDPQVVGKAAHVRIDELEKRVAQLEEIVRKLAGG